MESGPKKKKRMGGNTVASELADFGVQLKEADQARVDLARDRLAFEREKFDEEREERRAERLERATDRE